MISKNIRQAYSEVDEFLGLLSEEERNKVPKNLREIFKQEKDENYLKGINPTKEIKDQNLLEETLAIIAMLNLNYFCEDEEEKARLRSIYSKNEKMYQDLLQIGFNEKEIFYANKNCEYEHSKQQIIVAKKDSIFRRILIKITRIFKK